MFWDLWRARTDWSDVENIYKLEDTKNKVVDGELDYPNPTEEQCKGMVLELRFVSFSFSLSLCSN